MQDLWLFCRFRRFSVCPTYCIPKTEHVKQNTTIVALQLACSPHLSFCSWPMEVLTTETPFSISVHNIAHICHMNRWVVHPFYSEAQMKVLLRLGGRLIASCAGSIVTCYSLSDCWRIPRYRRKIPEISGNPGWYVVTNGQVRSGMGAYAGTARRRVHLATVLLRPPSGHRPGRRQARHARILQIGLHLTQPRSVWAPSRHGPGPRISTENNPDSVKKRIQIH